MDVPTYGTRLLLQLGQGICRNGLGLLGSDGMIVIRQAIHPMIICEVTRVGIRNKITLRPTFRRDFDCVETRNKRRC